jgi:hypothetical protein
MAAPFFRPREMSESPQENPYASPATGPAASPPDSGNTNFCPPALVPRWWEWLLYVLLIVVMGPMAWSFFSFLDQDGGLHDVGRTLPGEILRILISVTGFWLGLVALRVWWWKSLPEGLAPGHTLFLAEWYGAILLIGQMAAVHLLLFWFVYMTSNHEPTELVNIVSRVTLVGSVISTLGMCAILFALLPRTSLWMGAACGYFIVVNISTLRNFGILGSGGNDELFGSGLTMLAWLTHVAGLLVMFSFLAIAAHERWRGIHRDWLHWAGLLYWIAVPLRSMLHTIFETFG